MYKTRNEEIDYIHSKIIKHRLLRPLYVMRKFIIEATTTYTNISLFMNDYKKLYADDLIDERTFNSAINDLYLLALLHINDEEYERIREELEENAE